MPVLGYLRYSNVLVFNAAPGPGHGTKCLSQLHSGCCITDNLNRAIQAATQFPKAEVVAIDIVPLPDR